MIKDSITKRLNAEVDQLPDQPTLTYQGNGKAKTPSGGILDISRATNAALGIGDTFDGLSVDGSAEMMIDAPPAGSTPTSEPEQPQPNGTKVISVAGGAINIYTAQGVQSVAVPGNFYGVSSYGAGANDWVIDGYTVGGAYTSIDGNGASYTYSAADIQADLGFNPLNPVPSVPDGESFQFWFWVFIQNGFFTFGWYIQKSWTDDVGRAISYFRGSKAQTDTIPTLYGGQPVVYSLPGVILESAWSSGLRHPYVIDYSGAFSVANGGFWVTGGGASPTGIPLTGGITIVSPGEIYLATSTETLDGDRLRATFTQYDAGGAPVRDIAKIIPYPSGAPIDYLFYHP